jgi:tryptophanyl-tRNA synthetase
MDEQQVVTPWDVQGDEEGVNYTKVIKQFGCQHISSVGDLGPLLSHHFFRRGIVFAHRGFEKALQRMKEKKPIYLYTGRGPSSKSMHLGHVVPFLLTKFLQDTFDCPLVIQLTDDEKYIWKDITLEESIAYGKENARDIMAFGFDKKKTFIFSNVEYAHNFVKTTLQIEKWISLNEFMKVFGFTKESKIGQIAFPSKQLAPCYPTAFPSFLAQNALCLVPCSIDQDPYFRLARDVAAKLNCEKPTTLYSLFLPSLLGSSTKMSASLDKSSIYLSDTDSEIRDKVNKYAFSGGKDSVEQHRQEGGDASVDVAYQYLNFFLDDDSLLAEYKKRYESGEMLTSELKGECIKVLQAFVKEFKKRREAITEEDVRQFYSPNK